MKPPTVIVKEPIFTKVYKKKLENVIMQVNKVIPAIHANDLVGVLQKYNLLHDIQNGRSRCTECSKILTLDNLGSMRRRDGKLVFTCNDILCYYNVVNKNKK